MKEQPAPLPMITFGGGGGDFSNFGISIKPGVSLLLVSALPQLPCSFQPHENNSPSPNKHIHVIILGKYLFPYSHAEKMQYHMTLVTTSKLTIDG